MRHRAPETMIELIDVTVVRGDRVLLWDLNAVFSDGAVTVLTGPAGSGKSDLMRLLRGELTPSQGEIMLDRLALGSWSSTQLKLRCASLPQRSVLHFPFTVREVVDLGRIPRYPLCGREVHERIVDEALDWLELRPLAREAYASLAAADQKRVQLSRVLAQVLDANGKPPIHWLLDEPTAHLDDEGLAAFQRVVTMLKARNACVVLAIRDPRLAVRFATQLLIMEEGTLVPESEHLRPAPPYPPTRTRRFPI